MSDEHNAEALIAEIKRLLTEGAEVDAFLGPLHHLVGLSPWSVGSGVDPGTALYRVTKHHTAAPKSIEDVWFPPSDKTPMGRANRQHQPMFYCTSDPACAFCETSIAVGQTVVFAKWVTTTQMVLHDLGYTAQVLTRAGAKRKLPTKHQEFHDKLSEEGRLIRDFIAMEFTDPDVKSYALTTAVAEFHLREGGGGLFSGIMYPAVSKSARVDNLALRPSFVRDGMKLVEATLLMVDVVKEDRSIEGAILADLAGVSENGRLSWSFRGSGTSSVPPGAGMAVRFGEVLRVQNGGKLTIAGRRYQVDSGYLIEVSTSGDVSIMNLKGEKVEPLP